MKIKTLTALAAVFALIIFASCGLVSCGVQPVISDGAGTAGNASDDDISNGDVENTDGTTPDKPDGGSETYKSADGAFEDGDFYFIHDGYSLRVDDDFAPFAKAFGEPVSYAEAPSCNYEGMDKIYTYDGFAVYTYPSPDDASDRVSIIELNGDGASTPKGAKTGMTETELTAMYGECDTVTGFIRSYAASDGTLDFTVENGVVTLVEYLSLN